MHFFNDILATKVGIHEAIFLQNLYFLLKRRVLEFSVEPNKDLWIKLSSTRLQEFQPYFTRSQLRTIVKNLTNVNFVESTKRHLDYSSNVFSYTLTAKGWAFMIFLDTYESQEKLKEVAKTVENQSWGKNLELWLFLAKSLAKLDNPWLKLNKDWQLLANIYIEDRYLINNIDLNNNILNILDSDTDSNKKDNQNNKINISKSGDEDFSSDVSTSIENKSSFELEVNRIFENSYEFKRKVLKTFEAIENFKEKVLYPSVEKYSYSNVIKALKKVAENFFGYMSPVAEFFAVLNGFK